MAEKTEKLIIDALRRAAIHRGGVSPFATRNETGLFPNTPLGRQAADIACRDGLFVTNNDVWTINATGFAMLLERTSPRQVLEDCVRALEARQEQVDDLRGTVTRMYETLDGLRQTIEQALPTMRAPKALAATEYDLDSAVMTALSRWQADASEDCPLPELYRQVELVEPGQSVGAFHDAIRRLQANGRLYLHPWTGPLYRIPEPTFALMIGHEIAYYASGRTTPAAPDYSTDEAVAIDGRA